MAVCEPRPSSEVSCSRILSVLWVIFFVLLLTVLLDRLLFKPVLRVMGEREQAIRSARELAERSANEARLASAEFEKKRPKRVLSSIVKWTRCGVQR